MQVFEELIKATLLPAVIVAAVAPLNGLALMLLMGVLHHEISPTVPAIGFWPSVGIALLVPIVTRILVPQQRG